MPPSTTMLGAWSDQSYNTGHLPLLSGIGTSCRMQKHTSKTISVKKKKYFDNRRSNLSIQMWQMSQETTDGIGTMCFALLPLQSRVFSHVCSSVSWIPWQHISIECDVKWGKQTNNLFLCLCGQDYVLAQKSRTVKCGNMFFLDSSVFEF